jgi:hypothetical protein
MSRDRRWIQSPALQVFNCASRGSSFPKRLAGWLRDVLPALLAIPFAADSPGMVHAKTSLCLGMLVAAGRARWILAALAYMSSLCPALKLLKLQARSLDAASSASDAFLGSLAFALAADPFWNLATIHHASRRFQKPPAITFCDCALGIAAGSASVLLVAWFAAVRVPVVAVAVWPPAHILAVLAGFAMHASHGGR